MRGSAAGRLAEPADFDRLIRYQIDTTAETRTQATLEEHQQLDQAPIEPDQGLAERMDHPLNPGRPLVGRDDGARQAVQHTPLERQDAGEAARDWPMGLAHNDVVAAATAADSSATSVALLPYPSTQTRLPES